MRRYITLLGLITLTTYATIENNVSMEENNKTVEAQEENRTLVIDLEKEREKDGLKGGKFKVIKGLISLENNNEITFKGGELFVSTPITLYINDKLYATIQNPKENFSLKISTLKEGDQITIKNKFMTIVEKKVKRE